MANNRAEYENIIDKSQPITESVYINPVFDDHDEIKAKLPLLTDSVSSDNDEQSAYEEVAVNISNTDDPTMLCLTFRSLFIGILLTSVMSFTTQFFAYRTSPLDFNIGIIILLSYMIGKLMATILPKTLFNITINPGPFTVKENALITIMASSGANTLWGLDALTVQRLFYKYYLNHFSSILYLMIMHLFALSIAGILKRYLIWPASMIWPKSLMSCSLIRTLDQDDENNQLEDISKKKSRWTMTRLKFFWLTVLIQFLWYWLPGYMFPLLSFFSVICFIKPNNIIFAQVTGINGLGLGAFEFDWNAVVAYLDSPILVPFWAHVNFFIGFIVVIWIGTPICYYLNIWESKKMPIISNRVFDNDGYFYNVTKVLDANLQLNKTAYRIYGEVNVTAGSVISYGFMFAGISALLVHAVLYHGKSIVEQFRSSLSDKRNDIHARLMSHYPDIAEFWYYIMFLVVFIIAIIFVYCTGIMPGFAMFFSIVLTIIFALPNSIITAMTNMTITGTLPGDFLSGLILPGNPIGFLAFRTYTYTCQNQILTYLTSFKIGHYMKISPRVLFPLLILCSIISSITQYITAVYLLNHVPNICTSKNPSWKCLNTENTYTSSIIFSIAGSFNPGSKYFSMFYGLIIGSVLPIISWYLWKKFPNIKWLGLVDFPILLLATNNLPPAPCGEFLSWFLVGFIFNYVLYRYAHDWWEKYAYIFSAAMSCGVAICGFLIFVLLENNNIHFPKWWGLGGPTGDGCPLASANYSGFIPTDREL